MRHRAIIDDGGVRPMGAGLRALAVAQVGLVCPRARWPRAALVETGVAWG